MGNAKKHYGQNFLKDQKILAKIIEAAELTPTDHVYEVGPGEGALTEHLLQEAGHVTAIEIDHELIPFLKINFGKANNFTLIEGDTLRSNPPAGPYKLVANIPYYITSPILNHFLIDQYSDPNGNPPKQMVIMVQKEVADKIMAKEGHTVLSLQVHLFGTPELICKVPSSAFRPAPKVDSAVISIKTFDKPRVSGDLYKLLKLIHAGFSLRRKKLSNSLSATLRVKPQVVRDMLLELGLDEGLRAEDLSVEDWGRLQEVVQKMN